MERLRKSEDATVYYEPELVGEDIGTFEGEEVVLSGRKRSSSETRRVVDKLGLVPSVMFIRAHFGSI